MRTYNELNVGDSDFFEKTITETDVYMFAGVTGDFNPAHVNAHKMAGSKFGGRIAHGMLSGGLISAAIAMKLPGEGTIYLSQELNFLAPVRFGDTIKAEITVMEKLEKGRVKLKTTCYNQNGDAVVDGCALVIAPR